MFQYGENRSQDGCSPERVAMVCKEIYEILLIIDSECEVQQAGGIPIQTEEGYFSMMRKTEKPLKTLTLGANLCL